MTRAWICMKTFNYNKKWNQVQKYCIPSKPKLSANYPAYYTQFLRSKWAVKFIRRRQYKNINFYENVFWETNGLFLWEVYPLNSITWKKKLWETTEYIRNLNISEWFNLYQPTIIQQISSGHHQHKTITFWPIIQHCCWMIF